MGDDRQPGEQCDNCTFYEHVENNGKGSWKYATGYCKWKSPMRSPSDVFPKTSVDLWCTNWKQKHIPKPTPEAPTAAQKETVQEAFVEMDQQFLRNALGAILLGMKYVDDFAKIGQREADELVDTPTLYACRIAGVNLVYEDLATMMAVAEKIRAEIRGPVADDSLAESLAV